jgi:hypothetical protein
MSSLGPTEGHEGASTRFKRDVMWDDIRSYTVMTEACFLAGKQRRHGTEGKLQWKATVNSGFELLSSTFVFLLPTWASANQWYNLVSL